MRMLLFAQESMYWLTGYDSFGYCFFQCLVLDASGGMTLLTRSPDLRQAQHTSIIEDIRVWVDRDGAASGRAASRAARRPRLAGTRLGVEYDTHGLTAANGRAVDGTLDGFAALVDASDLVPRLRAVKSPAEIAYAREAARARRRGARRRHRARSARAPTRATSSPPCRGRSSRAAATIRPTNSSSARAPTRCSAATSRAGGGSTRATRSRSSSPASGGTTTPR